MARILLRQLLKHRPCLGPVAHVGQETRLFVRSAGHVAVDTAQQPDEVTRLIRVAAQTMRVDEVAVCLDLTGLERDRLLKRNDRLFVPAPAYARAAKIVEDRGI